MNGDEEKTKSVSVGDEYFEDLEKSEIDDDWDMLMPEFDHVTDY